MKQQQDVKPGSKRKTHYSTAEVALLMGRSQATVRRAIANGHIEASRPYEGANFRISHEEVVKLVGNEVGQ